MVLSDELRNECIVEFSELFLNRVYTQFNITGNPSNIYCYWSYPDEVDEALDCFSRSKVTNWIYFVEAGCLAMLMHYLEISGENAFILEKLYYDTQLESAKIG